MKAPTALTVPRAVPRNLVAPAAGGAYVLAWLAGLSVFSSSADVRSSGVQIVRAYRGHESAVALQYVLTEGLAGVFLGLVVWTARRRHGLSTLGVRAGLAAAAVSIVQCGLGLWLALAALDDADTTGTLYRSLNRLDGVKMLLLIGVGVAVTSQPTLPTWLRRFGAALSVSIAVSGLGYLAAVQAIALAAWVSLPCLIIVVAGLGLVRPSAGVPEHPEGPPRCSTPS
jgi:hypothetical protein